MTITLPVRVNPAHIITSDAEAIAIAHELAAEFAPGAAERDRDRRLPVEEIERFSQSGLWGITIPKEYGGAGVSYATLAEVIEIISAADPSIGQIPQNHLYMIEAIRITGTEDQKRFFFGRALAGDRFGNAFSEFRNKSALAPYDTRLLPEGDRLLLNGRKFYSTGALFAHWVAAVARDQNDRVAIAFVPPKAAGLTIIDDWSAFGQRTTASGSTVFENVVVDPAHVLPHTPAFESPSTQGAVAQIIQAAIDAGIARAALADTVKLVREYARPWADSGLEKASDDPYTIAAIGDLETRVHAAEALLERAGRIIDAATPDTSEEGGAAASVAVAEAKIATTEAALLAANKLHELVGTRSTLAAHNLDRHWRNARVHTLHDPARWKYHTIGNHVLNGVNPPRHGAS